MQIIDFHSTPFNQFIKINKEVDSMNRNAKFDLPLKKSWSRPLW